LTGIQAWYAVEGVSEVGGRLVAEIFKRVEVLAEHPSTRASGVSFRSSAKPSARVGTPSFPDLVYRLDP
jgi:hypothetical protein